MFSTYNLSEFGKRLRLIRSENGVTQAKVRELTGIHEDTLRRIENGMVIPKYETLEALSHIYKTDLAQVLKNYRNNKYISDFYTRLDSLIISNDTELIPHLRKSIKKLQEDKAKLSLINPNELLQLEAFLRGAVHYFNDKFTHYDDLIKELTETLCLSISGFSLSNIDKHKYSPLEIRILLLIGLIQVKKNDIHTSTTLLEFCLKYLLSQPSFTMESIKLNVKLYYNIAYNHHMLDLHTAALEYSDAGIEYVLNNNLLYCLPYLYARKSVAEFLLDEMNYKKSFNKSIGLFLILEDKKTADLFQDLAKKEYGIVLESLDEDQTQIYL